jgi:hypothetical protein
MANSTVIMSWLPNQISITGTACGGLSSAGIRDRAGTIDYRVDCSLTLPSLCRCSLNPIKLGNEIAEGVIISDREEAVKPCT